MILPWIIPIIFALLPVGESSLLVTSLLNSNVSGLDMVLIYDNNDKIYMFGGSNGTTLANTIYQYSISRNKVKLVGNFPVNGISSGVGFIAKKKRVYSRRSAYYCGGSIQEAQRPKPYVSDVCYKISLWDFQVSYYDSLPNPIVYGCLLQSPKRKRAYITSGFSTTNNVDRNTKILPQPNATQYDYLEKNATVHTTTEPLLGRIFGSCATSGNSQYFFGGITDLLTLNIGVPLLADTIQKFTPPNTITSLTQLSCYTGVVNDTLLSGSTVTTNDGTIYVVGGLFRSGAPNFLSIFNPVAGSLTAVPVEGFSDQVLRCNVVYVPRRSGDRLYIIGGWYSNGTLRTDIVYIKLHNSVRTRSGSQSRERRH